MIFECRKFSAETDFCGANGFSMPCCDLEVKHCKNLDKLIDFVRNKHRTMTHFAVLLHVAVALRHLLNHLQKLS